MTASAHSQIRFDPYVVDLVADRYRDWEIDLANAELSPTSTVRGWESMPALVS
ncbi:hypothetical protein [Mycobacterium angelicum]|uniref:hypothetical protein n=1 Tax=Mycobacterium angelicum TaxID=470074 RepID=UPI001473E565|nr:hypothetical protein [Mycobacterium angelicum]MCV7199147.1 hypothetical protein [Mycobacterium angelicum]